MAPTNREPESELDKARQLKVGEGYRFDTAHPHSFHAKIVSVDTAMRPPTIRAEVTDQGSAEYGQVVSIELHTNIDRWQSVVGGVRGVCFFYPKG